MRICCAYPAHIQNGPGSPRGAGASDSGGPGLALGRRIQGRPGAGRPPLGTLGPPLGLPLGTPWPPTPPGPPWGMVAAQINVHMAMRMQARGDAMEAESGGLCFQETGGVERLMWPSLMAVVENRMT